MIPTCLAVLALGFGQQDRQVTPPQFLLNPDGSPSHLMVMPNRDPLSPVKVAPLKGADPKMDLSFPYVVAGYENLDPLSAGNFRCRLRVFAQDSATQQGLATQTARMLMRLWEMTYTRLDIDHSPDYNGGIVDVYLCKGGLAGGEQMFGEDTEGTRIRKVDTIYIYDVATFTDPVEKAREVAHEYGHAILPAIGGYKSPERWANGYLGEKLFLSWVDQELSAKRLTSDDAMGAPESDIRTWLASNVAPLIKACAMQRPDTRTLSRTDKVGMDAYIGLALTVATLYPTKVFARSMKLTGSTSAKDYPLAIAMATEEPEIFSVTLPAYLAGHSVWLPLGKAKISGATLVKRDGSWVLLKIGARPALIEPIRQRPDAP